MRQWILSASLFIVIYPHAHALETTLGVEANLKRYQRQEVQGEVKRQSILINLSWLYQDWSLDFILPYSRINYAVTGTIHTGSRRQRQLSFNREKTVQGAEDASLRLAYAWQQQQLWFSPSVEAKWDNGDVTEGLGSGSRDGIFRLSSAWDEMNWGLDAGCEYRWIIHKQNAESSYHLCDVGARWQILEDFNLGVRYTDEHTGSTNDLFKTYFRWQAKTFSGLMVQLYQQHHQQEAGHPKTEYGLECSYRF